MGSCQKYDPFALSDSNDEDDKKEIEGHHELYNYEAKYKKDRNSLTPEVTLYHDDQSSGDKDSSSSFSDEVEENNIRPNDLNFIPVPNLSNKNMAKGVNNEPFIPPPPKDPYPENVSGLTKQYKFNDNSVANLIAKASAKLMQEPMNNSNQTSNLPSHQTHAIHSKLPLFGKRGKFFVPTQLRIRRQVEDQQQNLKSKNSMQDMFNEEMTNSYDDANNQSDAPTSTGEHGGKKTNIYLPEPLDKRISLINDESIPFPKTIDIPKPSLAHIPQPGNAADIPTPKITSDLSSSITTPSVEVQTGSVDTGMAYGKKVEKVEGAKRKFYQSYEAWAQSVHQDQRPVVNSTNTDVLGQQPKPVAALSDQGDGSNQRGYKSSPKRHSPTTSGGGYGKGTTRGRSPLPTNNKNGDRRRMTSSTNPDRKRESFSRRIVLPDEGSTTFSVTRFLDPLPNIGRDPTSSNILYLHPQRGERGRGIEGSGAKVKLAWPVDILKYTRTQPCITYACNPRQFNLNKLSSRKADIVVDVLMTWPRKPLYPELTFVEAVPENSSPARAGTSPDTSNDWQDNNSPEVPIESRSPKPQPKNEECDLVPQEFTALEENCSTTVPSPSTFDEDTAIPMEHNDNLNEGDSSRAPNIEPEKEIAITASPALPKTELETSIEPRPNHNTALIIPDVDSNVMATTESPSSKMVVLQNTRDLQDASKPNTDIPPMSGPDLAAIQRLLGANLLNSDLANTLNDSLSPLLSVINNLVTLSLTNSPLLKSLSALLKTPGHIQKLIYPQPGEEATEIPSKEGKKSSYQVTALQSGVPVDKAEQQPDTSPGELMQDITSLLMAHITPSSSSSVEVGAPKSEVPSPCVSILKAPSSTSNLTSSNLEPPQVERGEEEKGGRERIVAFDLPLDVPSPPSPSVRHKRALVNKGVKRKGPKKGHNSPSSPPPPPPPAPPHTTNVVKSRSKKGAKKDKKRRQDSESPPPPPPPPPPATKEVLVGEEVTFLSPRPQPPPYFTGLLPPQPSPYYYHQGVGTALGQQQPSPSLPMYLTHNVAAMYAPSPTLNYMNNTPHLQQQQQMGLYSNQVDYVAVNNSMNASVMSNSINTTLAQSAASPYNLLGISNSMMILPPSQPSLFMSPPPPDKSAKILVSQYANPNLIRIATTQTFV